jgi:hypothetical protein
MTKQEIMQTNVFYSLSTWVDPWWWVSMGIIIFVLCLVHPVPFSLDSDKKHSFKENLMLWIRLVAVGAFVFIGFILPLILYSALGGLTINGHKNNSAMLTTWVWNMFALYWMAPVAGLLGGLTIAMYWHRYIDPHLSNFYRRFRVTQAEDQSSDMRSDGEKFRARSFNPEKYYKTGYYFVGMDENNQPVYIADKAMHTTHMAIFGPTRFGKGVEFGVLIQQAINKGNGVFFIDPKGDEFLPYIMAHAAKKADKKFIYLDLNPEASGYWHPFQGGEERARRSRILATFKLDDSGTDADVFKVKERTLLDKALKATDGSIKELLNFVTNASDASGLSKLRDSLAEWSNIKSFNPPKKYRGHSIETSIKNKAIVYIRGSIDDEVIRQATRCYLSELIQEIRRLKDTRDTHITLGVDEVRFLVSNEVVTGLATIAGANCNMILASQAISDLRNIADQNVDKDALQQSFIINCQIKLMYRAGDEKTAEYGEKNSGTKWITQALNESTEINKYGGENWSNQRSMSKSEVPLIHRNTFLSLPPMVGVLFEPHTVPKVLFTAFIKTDISVKPWEKTVSEDKKNEPEEADEKAQKEVA